MSAVRVKIGGFCVKGGGHVWTYKEGPDGCSGWDLFIELDPEDAHLFPQWIQDSLHYELTGEWNGAVLDGSPTTSGSAATKQEPPE